MLWPKYAGQLFMPEDIPYALEDQCLTTEGVIEFGVLASFTQYLSDNTAPLVPGNFSILQLLADAFNVNINVWDMSTGSKTPDIPLSAEFV
jgi:hypothetical protein